VSEQANIVKDLIDRGLAPVQADMTRFRGGLAAMTATSERPPASAMTALRAARDHAAAGHKALLGANQGHIRLMQGGSQAIRGFLYLNQGLSALISGLSATGATATGQLAAARRLLARSGDEFYAADRALGCPYGCHKPATVTVG
jgi:hypothetical protein